MADAFCASRLAGEGGAAFGTLPRGLDLRAIAERAAPYTSTFRDAREGAGPKCRAAHQALKIWPCDFWFADYARAPE